MPHRELHEIGLGSFTRTVIYALSVLPLVGLVIGASYWTRRNRATRAFGQQLFWYAAAIHGLYVFCICPSAAVWALSQ